jgi:hypothetical protein
MRTQPAAAHLEYQVPLVTKWHLGGTARCWRGRTDCGYWPRRCQAARHSDRRVVLAGDAVASGRRFPVAGGQLASIRIYCRGGLASSQRHKECIHDRLP